MKRDSQRKFLVNELWRPDRARGTRLRQGYLSTDSDRLVRVVTEGNQGTRTITRVTPGGDRIVVDYEIPRGEADLIQHSLCLPPLLEKERFREVYDPRYFSSNFRRHPFTRWSHGRAGDERRLPSSKPVPASRG